MSSGEHPGPGADLSLHARSISFVAEAHALHVGLAAVAVAALNVVFVRYSPGPVLYSDSMGYLATARTLAGAGQPINLDFSFFTAVGYGLLLAPAYLVTVNPHTVFLFAAGVNVAACASIVAGAYRLARDVFGSSHRASVLIGVLSATYPTYLLQSGQVWPEVVLAAFVVWWVVLLTRFLNSGTAASALGCGLLTGFAWSTHRRMGVMVLVTLIVLALAGWRRHDRRTGAVVAASSIFVLMAGTWVLERWLRETMWTTPIYKPVTSARFLADLRPATALVLVGQAWYLAAASLGLTVLGVLSLLRLVSARWGSLRTAGDTQGLAAGALLCAFFGTLVVVALQIGPGRYSATYLVYGRYTDEYSGALIAAAGASIASMNPSAVLRRASLLIPPAFLFVSAGLLYEIRGRGYFAGWVQKLNIAGILPEQALVEGRTIASYAIHIRPITVIAAAIFIALMLLVRIGPLPALGAATIAFVVLGYLGMTRSLHPFIAFTDDAYRCIPTVLQERYGSSGTVAVDLDHLDPWARNKYQFLLPNYRFVYFHGSKQRPPADLVVAPQDWRQAHSDGFSPVTGEFVSSEALWVSSPKKPRPVQISLPYLAIPCPAVTKSS